MTIIIFIILTMVGINYGKEAIKLATFQNTKTNMLLIEVKAKECVENANFDLGIKPTEATQEMKDKARSELKGTQVSPIEELANRLPQIGINSTDIANGNVFKFTSEDLQAMSIKNVESNDEKGWYVVVYDIENASVKVYHTYGVQLENKQIKYLLDDFRDINV